MNNDWQEHNKKNIVLQCVVIRHFKHDCKQNIRKLQKLQNFNV